MNGWVAAWRCLPPWVPSSCRVGRGGLLWVPLGMVKRGRVLDLGRRPFLQTVLTLGMLLAFTWADRSAARPAAVVQFELEGHTGGAIRAVTAEGDQVWIGQGIGVSRVDLADGESAAIVEHEPLGVAADVYSLCQHGRFLYVGARDGLHVVDVGGPGGARVLLHVPTPGTVRAIAHHQLPGDGPALLFLSDDLAGVLLAEVNGPEVTVTAVVPSDGGARTAAAVVDGLALIPGDDLYVVSLAVPQAPVEVGRLTTRGQVRGVVAGLPGSHMAYVSDSAEGLLAVDLAVPSAPRVRGSLGGVPTGSLTRLGQVLYIVDRGVSLVAVAEDDPSRMSYVGVYGGLTGALSIALVGPIMLAAANEQLIVAGLHPANPLYQPQVLARLHSAWPIRQHALVADHVYVARGEEGLMAFRVDPPDDPQLVLEYRPPWGAFGLSARGDRLYVSTVRGFEVWDVADPASPVPLTSQPFADWGPTSWIATTDSRLVATTRERLHIASLNRGPLPVEVAELVYARQPAWPQDAVPQGIALFGENVVYVPAGDAGVAVLSIDDQDQSVQPELRAFVTVPAGIQARTALVEGSLLLVGTQDGVVIYDLADPLRPQPLAHHRGGYGVLGLALVGSRLYVAADMAGLVVLDIVEPRLPSIIGWLRLDHPVTGVLAAGRRLYMLAAGLAVLEAADLSEMTPPATSRPLPTLPPLVPTTTPEPTSAIPSLTPTATPSPSSTATATLPVTSVGHVHLPCCYR